jgi:glycosyltransferase involved in cell wall biosynthesis
VYRTFAIPMNILFVVPYPKGQAPSQRFRYEQYLPALEAKGWNYTLASFLDVPTWQILYKPGHAGAKVWGTLKGFGRRLKLLFQLKQYDYVFLHREATPIGPPWFEWMAAKVAGSKIIYDFDDAIWMADASGNNKVISFLKWQSKVASICRWSHKVSCGNAFLQEYARQFNPDAILNPTTIDTEGMHNQIRRQSAEKVIIGWTGSHTTNRYLDMIVPVLQRLEKEYDFEFRVISNQSPELPLRSFTFRPWRKDTEIPDLLTFHIGLMPLEDEPWAKGKCAFKALQYMALGIPAVVSPVGCNTEVVDHGVNGYLCTTEEEWYQSLAQLLQNPELRAKLGHAARQKIVGHYSVVSNTANFLALFEG